MSSALQKLADQITDTEQQHPDSVLIILGDFNKANLPVNCQNTDSMLHVPPETVIYWITVIVRAELLFQPLKTDHNNLPDLSQLLCVPINAN